MIVLGIETSCDDTAVGIVNDARTILAHCVFSQLKEHKPFGGVVPEVAARAHADHLDRLIDRAMTDAHLTYEEIDAVAATCGPGLIGGVMVGAVTGKAMAAVLKKPFIAVNHLEAHALTVRLGEDVTFPYLLLLVSGGHSQLLLVHQVGSYERLGGTLDDAVGECFDKCAKLLGLGYPGGPLIEALARNGNAMRYALPIPMQGRDGYDFSFSGLKTSVRTMLEKMTEDERKKASADIAASLQKAIADSLVDRVGHALAALQQRGLTISHLVAAGGVAANQSIRQGLLSVSANYGVMFCAAPPHLCTDNGVMVAWAGIERLRLGKTNPLDVAARPRWPLTEVE